MKITTIQLQFGTVATYRSLFITFDASLLHVEHPFLDFDGIFSPVEDLDTFLGGSELFVLRFSSDENSDVFKVEFGDSCFTVIIINGFLLKKILKIER